MLSLIDGVDKRLRLFQAGPVQRADRDAEEVLARAHRQGDFRRDRRSLVFQRQPQRAVAAAPARSIFGQAGQAGRGLAARRPEDALGHERHLVLVVEVRHVGRGRQQSPCSPKS